jgi:hypothetical protein
VSRRQKYSDFTVKLPGNAPQSASEQAPVSRFGAEDCDTPKTTEYDPYDQRDSHDQAHGRSPCANETVELATMRHNVFDLVRGHRSESESSPVRRKMDCFTDGVR